MRFLPLLLLCTLSIIPGGETLIIWNFTQLATSNSDIQQYLHFHNTIRMQHGATNLTYAQDLAAAAQNWANNCKFKHSGGTLGPFGENLAAGAGSGKDFEYSIGQGIKSWTGEAKDYNPRNPQPSHFTQVVWKGTKQVGCASQQCDGIFDPKFGKATYYVCEYRPAGNVIGHFQENVQLGPSPSPNSTSSSHPKKTLRSNSSGLYTIPQAFSCIALIVAMILNSHFVPLLFILVLAFQFQHGSLTLHSAGK